MIDDGVYCLNQVFRPRVRLSSYMRNGGGDCTVCVKDPNGNGHCVNYHPIRLYTFNVVERDADAEAGELESVVERDV